ncbi:MAG: helix-turn-helix domain-containing protein [Thermoleophilia bacterium]
MFEIGSTLRETRVRRKTTLQQAEDDTKIRVKYIQAMENDDFDLMPSPAYVKGFLRTYSLYLGLDADVMLDEYRSRFEPNEEHEPFGGNSALGRPHAHRRRNTLTFIAVVCLLILGLLYVLGRYNSSNKPTTPPPPVTIVSHTPQASPTVHHTSTPSGQFAVRVVADRGSCWVQARKTGIAGPILYEATMSQGQSHLFKARHPIYLRLGVPAYVSIAVDGKGAFRPAETVANNYEVTRKGVVRL